MAFGAENKNDECNRLFGSFPSSRLVELPFKIFLSFSVGRGSQGVVSAVPKVLVAMVANDVDERYKGVEPVLN